MIESPEALLAGVEIAVLGYQIKYREWTFLIAGYDASSQVPKSAAANIVGNLAIRVGVATSVFGAVAVIASIPGAIVFAFVAIIVLGATRAIY